MISRELFGKGVVLKGPRKGAKTQIERNETIENAHGNAQTRTRQEAPVEASPPQR